MTIYSPSGAVVYEAPITKSAIIRRELMGDYYIELVFDAVDRIDIGRGCYILYNNHRFEIMNNVIPDDTNQGGLRYTLRFESQQSQMKRCNVFWREGDNLEVSFALTSDISTFGQLIIDNVNAFLGGSTFSLGSVPSGAEMKAISFAGDSCWDAVATIAETFGVEWWTEEDGDNVRLCFGKLEIGESVEFRKGDIVSSIPSKKGDDANYGTRFYVFGSTKNLPEDYGSTVEGGITNNVVEKRLHLPNGMQYIDAWPNLAPEDIVEKTVFFEDVMPTNVETITEVYSGNAQVIPGTSHKVYDVVCANSPFTLDDVIEGETIQANFTSGSLNGQTFDLELTQTSGVFNKTFRIVPKILDKDSLTILPQGEMIPRAGDTFILLNVNLPKGRIDEAEQRLLEVGQEYVKKNSSDTEIYDCPTNAVYCHKNDCNYALGQRVTLVGDMFGDGRQSRIQGYEKKLYDEYQATYTVGDNSAYSRLASLEKSIRQANYSDRVGLEANIIRSKNDATIPSDFNVYSALASEEMFLSKRRGGTVKGHTNFEKGISMYGIPIVYDEETKTWVFEGNLVTTRGISAWSSLSTPVASLFEALPIDGVTIKRDPITNELYVDTNVVGGSGGGSLDEELLEEYLRPYATQSWVTGKGYITSSALEPYALKTAIPTNTNQLTNGAGFITASASITGNAATASKLKNSVSLWGRTFDGTADLTGSLNVTTGEGYRITYNNYDLCFIVSGSSSNRGIWDGTNGDWLMYRNSSTNVFFPQGNIAIGSHTTPTERLSVNGNINLSGAYNYKIQGKDVVSIYSTNYYLADSAIELGYNTFVVGRKINFQTSTTTTKTTTATLDGSGNFSITGVLKLPAVDSGFTNPRITFGDSVIRIGATTAGLLGVYASGDIRLNPNSASSANSTMGLWLKTSGFNGINISNPTQALHVNGKGIFADATNPWVALQRNGENWYLQVVSTGLKLGKTSASGILVDASGNLVAPGGVTATNSSDKRLKRNLRKFNASKVLMSLGGVWEYEYIDSEVQKNHIYEGVHYGLIYQNVKGTTLDVMCYEREDGMGQLNYLSTKFLSLIAGATMENISEVEEMKRKIRHLEAQVKQLESRA